MAVTAVLIGTVEGKTSLNIRNEKEMPSYSPNVIRNRV
jgi:hypothetical protein